ncbi:hypothetical protein ABIA06_006945 [Bradyrhizobium yuanmingense]
MDADRGHASLCPPYDIECVASSLPLPSLRAQRSNPVSLHRSSLDCFAALAMTEQGATASFSAGNSICRHTFAASRLISPELCFIPSPQKKEGAGKTGCRRAPAVRCAKSTRRETAQQHTGVADHSAFPARWSDGLCRALPGAEFLLASLAPRIDDAVRPVGLARISAASLTVATTARTTRFCRTQLIRLRQEASPDFSAVRLHAASGSQGLPALPAPIVPTLPRPPQPGPRFERPANRPSFVSRAGSIYAAIPNFGKAEYFMERG